MSKKELNKEQLEKVHGGEETNSTQGLFKPVYVANQNQGGSTYNTQNEIDQYQPDLIKSNN